MKIAFVSSFYEKPMGGAEISSRILAEELRKMKNEVVVLTNSKVKNQKDSIPIPKASLIPTKLLILGTTILDIFIAESEKKEIQKLKPDIIHIQDRFLLPASLLVAKELKIPTVMTVRDTFLEWVYDIAYGYLPSPIRYAAKRRIKKIIKCLGDVDFIIADSDYIRKELLSMGIKPHKICTIYAELLPSHKKNVPNVIPKLDGTTRYLASGRLSKVKGFDVLLNALSLVRDKYPKFELFIAGDGPQRRELQTLTNALGIQKHVKFLGKIPYYKMQDIYLSSDIVIVPSIYPEPFGRVALEAMSVGRPVIASNIGGLPEIIGNKAGILVPPSNPKKLADAILLLSKDSKLRKKMSKAGKKISKEKFNTTNIVKQILRVYKRVLEEYSNRRVVK